jgi:hypothetical protein
LAKHKARVEAMSYVVTYGRLLQIARQGLRQAKAANEGSLHNIVSSIVFSAFSVEAYLNHVGATLYSSEWKDRAPVRKKLEFLSQKFSLTLDLSERPFSSFDAMFRFRNRLAHGRTEELTADYETHLDDEHALVPGPMTEWELICTLENAERFLDDAKAIINNIHGKTGLDTPAIGYLGLTGSSITSL